MNNTASTPTQDLEEKKDEIKQDSYEPPLTSSFNFMNQSSNSLEKKDEEVANTS